ncbi:MAG: hypothetical protein ACM3QZ_10745 [Solirubrobacterales bacterium]
MIDTASGNLVFDNGKIIRRAFARAKFVESDWLKEVFDTQEYSWTNYYLQPQKSGNRFFIVILCFNPQDTLEFVQIGLTQKGKIPSREHLTEQQELRRKEDHDKWLKQKLGPPPYKYKWGAVASNLDPKSGASIITIRYNVDTDS